ncbi:MAG: hypothetical protein QOH24_2264 [Verrucomicrobiota bacterium]|jgi:hypothetical protein
MWKALLLIYRELEVKLPISGRGQGRFRHRASEQSINDAVESFAGFPDLVRDLTGGSGGIRYTTKEIARPLASLTPREENEFWPSPDDTRIELDEFAPAGQYDSIFVFWPQHDLEGGTSVPGSAWGLGMGASDWANGATYAAVSNAPGSAWRNEARGEVWLHEWLHGVCQHFAQRGYAMPEGDADGAELHGYERSSTMGWTRYYRDLMSGMVAEGGKLVGIPLLAWIESSGGSRIAPR